MAIAAQNIGVVFAPRSGPLADRTRAYRAIFFAGFILIAAGFLGFTLLHGLRPWLASAFLIGLGTGASNTVAALFIVEFAPKAQWSPRISWLQTFNAVGSMFGMALVGFLSARLTTLVAAPLAVPALVIGARGLPVPGGTFHLPHLRHNLKDDELLHLPRYSGPNAASVIGHLRRPRRDAFVRAGRISLSGFGLFLAAWFLFSLAVSSFGSLYRVLMDKRFDIDVARASMLMSVATGISIPLYNFAGRLTTRRGPGASLRIGLAARMATLGGLAMLAFFHPGWVILPVIALFGSYQGIWPLLSVASNDLAADLAQFGAGAAMDLFNATAALASACGAIVGGTIADHFGYPGVCAFAALGALAALGCAFGLRGSAPGASGAAPQQQSVVQDGRGTHGASGPAASGGPKP